MAALLVVLIGGSQPGMPGCGDTGGGGMVPSAAPVPAGYPFSSSSVWRADVSSAPVAARSGPMVAYLAKNIAGEYGGMAALNVHRYTNNLYVAAPDTPLTDVSFDDCQHKGYLPAGLLGPGGQFTAVPIPAGAVPAAGTDSTITIYSPSSDRLWEFWRIQQSSAGGWSACWGGRMEDVSHSPGFFLHGYGASASGLATTGGTVSLADVRSGAIHHALALALTNPAVYTRVSWPAQRSDGWDKHPDALPEGTRLRLDPSVDVAALKLTPVGAMIAEAAQTYGFILTDKSGGAALVGEGGAAEQAATGTDPWDSLLRGVPDYEVLKNFPWHHLQVLPPDYGRPRPPCR